MAAIRALVLASLLASWGQCAEVFGPPSPSVLKPFDTYFGQDQGNGSVALSPQRAATNGELLAVVAAATPEACSAQCLEAGDLPPCSWFNWCGAQAGCDAPHGSLGYGHCHLLAAKFTELPEVERGVDGITTGFPVRHPPQPFPGFRSFTAQGLLDSDFSCPESLGPGVCALALSAGVLVCTALPACRTIVVLVHGIPGGPPGPLALLKGASLTAANSFMAPSVHSLQKLEEQPMASKFVPATAGAFSPPTPDNDDAAAEAAAADGNSSSVQPYMGCTTAANTLLEGSVVEREEHLTAEGCCRACRARPPESACNVWNWCGRRGGCRQALDNGSTVELAENMCELRFNRLSSPDQGYNPTALARGPDVPFTAGFPMPVAAPQLPGYTQAPGRTLYTHGHFNCSGTLRPSLGECVLLGTPAQLAERCNQDPQCVAFILKPGLLKTVAESVMMGELKHDAAIEAQVLTPTSILYVRDDRMVAPTAAALPAQPVASSAGGLPAGAVAGVVVGVAAAGALAAGTVLLALRRRRLQGSAARRLQGATARLAETAQLYQAELSPRTAAALVRAPSASPPLSALLNTSSTLAGELGGTASLKLQRSGSLGAPAGAANGGAGLPAGPQQSSLAAELSRLEEQQGAPGEGGGLADVVAALPAPLQEWVVSSADFSYCRLPNGRLHELGSGASPPCSARVYKAVLRGEAVAAKELDIGARPALHCVFLTEALQLQHLRHPCIVSLQGVAILPPTPILPAAPPAGEAAGGSRSSSRGSMRGSATVSASSSGEESGGSAAPDHRSTSAQQQPSSTAAAMAESSKGYKGVLLLEYCEGRDLYRVLQLRAPPLGGGKLSRTGSPSLSLPIGSVGAIDGGSGRVAEGAAVVEGGRGGERLFGWYRRGPRIAYDVARGLNFLHSRGVCHADVKSPHVLLTASGAAKLANVGFARLQTATFLSTLNQIVGTFAWVAPEILQGQRASAAIDIYSFGIVLWEIVTGDRPRRGWQRPPLVPQECPQQVADLIACCTALDPGARPTTQELVAELGQLLGLQRHGSGGGSGALPPAPVPSPEAHQA